MGRMTKDDSRIFLLLAIPDKYNSDLYNLAMGKISWIKFNRRHLGLFQDNVLVEILVCTVSFNHLPHCRSIDCKLNIQKKLNQSTFFTENNILQTINLIYFIFKIICSPSDTVFQPYCILLPNRNSHAAVGNSFQITLSNSVNHNINLLLLNVCFILVIIYRYQVHNHVT
jgi:hypothetical protein